MAINQMMKWIYTIKEDLDIAVAGITLPHADTIDRNTFRDTYFGWEVAQREKRKRTGIVWYGKMKQVNKVGLGANLSRRA